MKKIISLLCVLSLFLASLGILSVGAEPVAAADVWDGTIPEGNKDYHFAGEGTEQNPYLIQSAADLAQLAANVRMDDADTTYDNKYFALITDIDMDSHPWMGIGGATEQNGTSDKTNMYFSGNFDGCGHKIYNFTLADRYWNGLFGHVQGDATIKNIGIESGSSNLTGKTNIGAIIGCLNGGTIEMENCYNKSNITVDAPTAYAKIGGIVGEMWSGATRTFKNIYNAGNISVTNCDGKKFRVGGVFGNAAGTGISLENVYGFGAVSVTHNQSTSGNAYSVGVIAGVLMNDPVIKNCYANADVSCVNQTTNTITTWHTGPFIGHFGGTPSAETIQNATYTITENTLSGLFATQENTWGVGNSATVAANSYILPAEQAKTLTDVLANGSDFIVAVDDGLATTPAFIGVQKSDAVGKEYSVRFIMGLDSLDYNGAEFEIEAKYNNGTNDVIAKNGYVKLTTAYREIYADGKSETAFSNGHNYMALMVVNGVPTDTDIEFTVKSYVYVDGVKTLVDTDVLNLNVASVE